jgi:hypothetical protein
MGSPRHRRDGVRGARDRARAARRDRRGRPRDHRIPRVALALALTLLGAACDRRGANAAQAAVIPPKQEESFTAIESASRQFLPRQEEVPGWRLEQDPIVVPGNKLSTYMDQDAATFARYDVIDMTAGNYVATDGNGFATVEIFRFPDFVKAFGAYSRQKDGPVQFLNIANEAFIKKYSIHLWRGPFYIRVTGGAAKNAGESLTRLTAFVADRMPAAAAKPAVFNFFPVTGRVANSERYSADQALGLRLLANSFQAAFNIDNQPINGIIIPAANRDAAAKLLDAFRNLYVRNGKLMDPVVNLGEDNFTAEDKYMGRTVAFRIDRFLIAFNGFNDRQKLIDLASSTDQRILGTIRKQLVTADQQTENRPSGNTNENPPPWAQRH